MSIRKTIRLIAIAMLICMAAATAAQADTQYIFPNSNKKHLTWEEVEAWDNEALHIGFNEIWARHGYVFNPGGACDRWFSAQEWYQPITHGDNQHNVLPKASQLERDNYHLIKDVMEYKRQTNQQNRGRHLPPLPLNFDLLSGFQYVQLKTGQNLPVYSAPSTSSWRGANGRAAVSTSGRVYAYGQENGWLMVMYETNASSNAVRVGWVDASRISGKASLPGYVSFSNIPMTLEYTVNVTDDPVGMTSMTALPAGAQVTWLSGFYSGSHMWDYIEFSLNGQRARGFVLSGALQTENTDTSGWQDDGNNG